MESQPTNSNLTSRQQKALKRDKKQLEAKAERLSTIQKRLEALQQMKDITEEEQKSYAIYSVPFSNCKNRIIEIDIEIMKLRKEASEL